MIVCIVLLCVCVVALAVGVVQDYMMIQSLENDVQELKRKEQFETWVASDLRKEERELDDGEMFSGLDFVVSNENDFEERIGDFDI